MIETWYVFDLDPHLDPNFVEWLRSKGIDLKFNIDGRRGAIVAQDACDAPPLPPESYLTDGIPRITVGESECIPDDLSPYFEEGKKTKAYSTRQLHCGYSNFGRQKPEPPKCNNPECLEYWRKECLEYWRKTRLAQKNCIDELGKQKKLASHPLHRSKAGAIVVIGGMKEMTEGSWIKRSQELPPDGQEVLGWFVAEEGALEVENSYMLVQWSEYENAFNDENAFNVELSLRGEITHWQCLPVPPR